jgi:hypothetical protein
MTAGLVTRARWLAEQTGALLREGSSETLRAVAAPSESLLLELASLWPPGRRGRARATVRVVFGNGQDRALLALAARTVDGLTLSDRVWRTGAAWQRAATAVVEDAVATDMDARRAARELERYLEPGVATVHKRETARRLGIRADVSYPAMRLARTELQLAATEGSYLAYRTTPGYAGVLWRLSREHEVPDVCDDMAATTRYGRPGFYPRGLEPAPPHPQCLCHTVPVVERLGDLAERLSRWADDPATAPDLEAWYRDVARPVLDRPASAAASPAS